MISSERNKGNSWSNFEINVLAVISNQLNGFGPADFKKYFSFLNFRTESFEKLHFYCEDKIGKSLLEVCAQSMSRKIEVEWDLSRKHFNIIPGQDQDNDKIPLVIKQDMQWPQRGFYSPG